MPKNKAKGGKRRRKGKNMNDFKRDLVLKEPQQEYAQVVQMLGNGRLSAYCFDGKTRLCTIRGKMRKKVWVNQSDIVLIGLRDFQDEKGDVILKYTAEESRKLQKLKQIPSNIVIGQADAIAEKKDLEQETVEPESDDEEINFEEI
ncbi:hypothetical protein MHBO_001950 [Bonamia ostreae]|uniref:S1-like domain-containing protein n=1 Tax=Bonamia ostreae TaxID=126728 RepID=A0ABV2AKR9_9EUKA